MDRAKPLPAHLVQRYHGWRATGYAESRSWYRRLAAEGQRPRTMIVACCDSRVLSTAIFGAEPGEFFIHRNVAGLVPAFNPDGDLHGTSAAIEYAVTTLRVANLIVLGHSACGGVKGCHDMCAGLAPELRERSSFVGRWMELLRPGYERVRGIEDEAARLVALEKEAVTTSLGNLMTFPFVAERVGSEDLALHGLWADIAEGALHGWDPARGTFAPL